MPKHPSASHNWYNIVSSPENRLLIDLLLVALILRLPLLTVGSTFLFDESFYVPAARALLAGLPDTNLDQPPLVKYLLAGSIAAIGDNPLGWRLPSLVAGVASVGLLYLISLKLTKSPKASAIAALLLALDPLHVVLSRVAMLDIFMLAFGLAATYIMISARPGGMTAKSGESPWLLAGALFGLALASKWPAAFMLAGSLLFMFISGRLKLNASAIRPLGLLLLAMALTYALTYVPFMLASGPGAFIDLQMANLERHLTMPAQQQTSPAWAWLVGRSPVWFGWNKPGVDVPEWLLFLPRALDADHAFAVIALANPAVWWPAVIAILLLVSRWGRMLLARSKVVAAKARLTDAEKFAVAWFLATWLPWSLLPRTQTFLYYMLPVLPAFAIGLSSFVQRHPHRWAAPVLLSAAVLGLVILYPLTVLLPMPAGYFSALAWWIGMPPPPL